MQDAPAELEQAVDALNGGDTAAAARAIDALLERSPADPSAQVLKARILRQRGALTAATELLVRARPHLTGDARFLSECGYLGLAAGDAQEAVSAFNDLVALRPEYADGHYNLAQALQLKGQVESAIVHLERALELSVERPHEVRTELGFALLQRRRIDDAQAQFEQALALAADCAPALIGLADVCAAQGLFDDAIAMLRQALEHDDSLVEARQSIIELKRVAAADDADVEVLRLALAAEPNAFDEEKLRFALAKALDDCGEHSEAFASAERANALKRARSAPYHVAHTETLVDRIIAAGAGDELAWRQAADPSRLPVVLVGLPRSGVALLELMLARHGRIEAAGELGYFERAARTVLAPYPSGSQHVQSSALADLAAGYIDELHRYGHADRVTNAEPGNVFYLGLIAALFPNAIIVDCRRDRLDTALSIFFQDFRAGHPYANSLDDIAHYMAQHDRLMGHWQAQLGDRIVQVSYEDLIDDPGAQLARLCQRLDLPFDPACLDAANNPPLLTSPSRWQLRQSVYAHSVGRWRAYRPWLDGFASSLGVSL